MATDNLEKIYEQIVAKEHKKIEKENHTIIEDLLKRVEMLEDQMKLIKG